MSDIEDYAYSPYDDLEDLLYDADPAPELADDLAEHTLHSPVYQDEDAVKNELQDYFSDWTYYSDDYMDDDPSLLRKDPQDGSPPKRAAKPKQTVKRGKKRKLVETQDIPPLDLDEDHLLTRCIQGTTWTKASEVSIPVYKEGQEQKVSLMKDWKQVFAVKDSGWGQSSANEDESWAKDMSLADMGLRTMPRQASLEQDTQQADDIAVSEEEMEDEAEDLTVEMTEETIASKGSVEPGFSKLRQAILLEEDDEGGGISKVLPLPESIEDDGTARKRRRVKPALPSPPDTNETVAAGVEDPQVRAAASPDEDAFMANVDSPVEAAPISTGLGIRQNKKRKATEEPEDGPTRSTASTRAKRVASAVVSSTPSAPTPSRTTRSTKTK